jgi:hypothetical protein
MAKTSRRGSQRYTTPAFRPYVTALGQVALAWNDLQDSFAGLFWTTMLSQRPQAGDMFDYTALHVWHSIRSDRSQRTMLQAAVNNSSIDWQRPTLKGDVKWMLKTADKIEDARNDAIHSPLFAVDHSLYGMTSTSNEPIAPAWWLFNPRAAKLSQRQNLLHEFRYCRDAAIVLSDYVRGIDHALINAQRPWPDRPRLPTRQPGNKAKRTPPRSGSDSSL